MESTVGSLQVMIGDFKYIQMSGFHWQLEKIRPEKPIDTDWVSLSLSGLLIIKF